MPQFIYKAFGADGALRNGSLEASSEELAARQLRSAGLLPFSLDALGGRSVSPWWQREVFAKRRLSRAGLAGFTRELSTLVNAHLAIDEALRLIARQNGAAHELAISLEGAIRSGGSLSQAIEIRGREFPPYYAAMVRAGEAGGNLGQVLDELSRLLEASQRIASRLRAALVYPCVLFAMSITTMGVVIAILVPSLTPLLEGREEKMPLLLATVISVRSVVVGDWPLVLVLACLLVAAGFVVWRRPACQHMLHHLCLRLPIFGTIATLSQSGRLSRTLGALLRGGVPLPNALRICRTVMSNSVIANAVGRIEIGIREGRAFSSLLDGGPFPEKLVQLAAVGERAGKLDEMLAHSASMFDDELQNRIERLMSLFSPLVTLVLGLAVGGLVMSVMDAILSVNEIAM